MGEGGGVAGTRARADPAEPGSERRDKGARRKKKGRGEDDVGVPRTSDPAPAATHHEEVSFETVVDQPRSTPMPRKAAEQQERDRSELQPANDDEKRAAQASTRGGDEAPPPSERYHASCAAPAAMRARGATKGWERPETTRLSGGQRPRCWTLVGNDPATKETTRLWKIAALGSQGEYNDG